MLKTSQANRVSTHIIQDSRDENSKNVVKGDFCQPYLGQQRFAGGHREHLRLDARRALPLPAPGPGVATRFLSAQLESIFEVLPYKVGII